MSESIASHDTIPLHVRSQAYSLVARAERVRRVLTAPSALPETQAGAKEELKALIKDAQSLWETLT